MSAEICQLCGLEYETVYQVPDDVWNIIKPTRYEGGGLLCPTCADRRARSMGLILFWSCAIGHFPEERLNG